MNKFIKIISATTAAFLAVAFLIVPTIMKADVEPGMFPEDHTRIATMRISAYSSSPDETDDTPFITANGTYVYDGVVATNALPFGTRIQIPALFGNKVFTVEDRMAKRFQDTVDIWMDSKQAALRFGVTHADIHILPSSVDHGGKDIALAK